LSEFGFGDSFGLQKDSRNTPLAAGQCVVFTSLRGHGPSIGPTGVSYRPFFHPVKRSELGKLATASAIIFIGQKCPRGVTIGNLGIFVMMHPSCFGTRFAQLHSDNLSIAVGECAGELE